MSTISINMKKEELLKTLVKNPLKSETDEEMDFQSGDMILPGETTAVNPGAQVKKKSYRSLLAYWLLGLCNNYGYVVMLTAASDIIGVQKAAKNSERNCTYMSTGAILLADIIPGLLIKFAAPFLPFFVNARIAICVLLASAGFILVAFSDTIEISILGVVATSFCSGLGEVTFLQYSSFYDRNVISTWSSGTGGAGVIGALSYALLQRLGLKTTLLVMLVVPATMAVSFWIILPKPSAKMREAVEIQRSVNREELNDPKKALFKKIKQVPNLLKYIIPFGLVYLFEYFINQGTFELINIRNSFLGQADQYRWLQVDYQIGVFLSRSSVNFFHIRHIWFLAVLQLLNVVVFTTEVIFYYIPSFWIMIVLTLWEGLLGGLAYVNTYYRISTEVPEEKKQFSMAITGFGDSVGITLAGLFAILAHNEICSLPLPDKF